MSTPGPDPTEFMARAVKAPDAGAPPPEIPTDRPTPARAYGFSLGSKDNFEVDREMVLAGADIFPEGIDIARQNRLFLYRAVRHLAQEEGIEQFLDLGSGLPVGDNVHEVAQAFNPDSRVVYVDNDPIVLTHGRALLADDSLTAVINADITDPDAILNASETRELLDFSRPVAVLLFSIPHCIPDDDAARRTVRSCIDRAPSGSLLTLSHIVSDTAELREETTSTVVKLGMPWKTRSPEDIHTWLEGLDPVEPGLGDINDWRPDPEQPPLPEVDPRLQPYLGASQRLKRAYEYGGVLRKP